MLKIIPIATFAIASSCMFAQAPGSQPSARPGTPGSTMTPQQQQPGAGGMQNPNVSGEPAQNNASKSSDEKFVKDAAMGGLLEVELGRLATQKGSSDSVKQFGQKMVDDHSKANDELKSVAGAQNINIPSTLDAKHQAVLDKMSKLSGTAFDRAYSKDMVKDHEQDVKEFQREAQSGQNPAIKDFASKTLPTLQQHLSMAKDMTSGKMASTSADRSQQ